MFCTICGARNSDEAIYCQKCGKMLEAEEETRIARPARNENAEMPDVEKQIFSISPTLMFVKIGYVLAVFGALLLAAFLAFISRAFQIEISAWYSVFFGLSMLLIPAFYHLKQKTVRYTLTDAKIEIDEGLIAKTTRNLPLRSVQDVTIAATVPQRILGFGNLIIDNASETGGKVILKNIDAPKKHAEILLKQMRRLNK
ncbi:MAG: PH domain-containing protein [Acidobacteriota bacterium]|nr:PH domain-containing protein [Acidobacteriota bacterium]